jgi:hypothetical protein
VDVTGGGAFSDVSGSRPRQVRDDQEHGCPAPTPSCYFAAGIVAEVLFTTPLAR